EREMGRMDNRITYSDAFPAGWKIRSASPFTSRLEAKRNNRRPRAHESILHEKDRSAKQLHCFVSF
ncbi:hypothetical protein AVEN_15060-2-1, partial [Araneus ventricosus]